MYFVPRAVRIAQEVKNILQPCLRTTCMLYLIKPQIEDFTVRCANIIWTVKLSSYERRLRVNGKFLIIHKEG